MWERLSIAAGADGASWGPTLDHQRAGWRPRMHRHDELELNLVLAGTGQYLVGGQRYRLAPGALIWLFPDQEHLLLERSRDYRMWILVWTPDCVARLARGPAAVLGRGDPSGKWCRQIAAEERRLLHALCRDLAQPSDQRLANAGLGYALLRAWSAFTRASVALPTTAVHPAVDRCLQRLRRSGGAEALPELAAEIGLSPDHLGRIFRQETGSTVTVHRQRLHLDRFLAAYDSGVGDMLTCALDAGFGSYAQFHRVFRREIGCAPRDWARRR